MIHRANVDATGRWGQWSIRQAGFLTVPAFTGLVLFMYGFASLTAVGMESVLIRYTDIVCDNCISSPSGTWVMSM